MGSHRYGRRGVVGLTVSLTDEDATVTAGSSVDVLGPVRRPCGLAGCLPPLRPLGCKRFRRCVPVPPPPHRAIPVPTLCGDPSTNPYSWGPHGGTACTISATSSGTGTDYV